MVCQMGEKLKRRQLLVHDTHPKVNCDPSDVDPPTISNGYDEQAILCTGWPRWWPVAYTRARRMVEVQVELNDAQDKKRVGQTRPKDVCSGIEGSFAVTN
jgi:hypothetical protein